MFTFTQLKQLKEIANGNFDEVRDAVSELYMQATYDTKDSQWASDMIRIIHEDDVDEVLREELSGDTYILGCFNADFLSGLETLNLDERFISELQDNESFEAIGELILRTPGCMDELVEGYVSADGYGNHFSHYDGDEHEVGEYLVFRTN